MWLVPHSAASFIEFLSSVTLRGLLLKSCHLTSPFDNFSYTININAINPWFSSLERAVLDDIKLLI